MGFGTVTADGGETWTNVYKLSMTHGGNQVYRAGNGTLYSGGYQYPARSTDNGSSWEQIKKGLVYSWYMGICGDGEKLPLTPRSASAIRPRSAPGSPARRRS